MDVGKKYVVTVPSLDGTFDVGDHIWIDYHGSIICKEAMGWVPSHEVFKASKGMKVTIDNEWRSQRIKFLLQELIELNYKIGEKNV